MDCLTIHSPAFVDAAAESMDRARHILADTGRIHIRFPSTRSFLCMHHMHKNVPMSITRFTACSLSCTVKDHFGNGRERVMFRHGPCPLHTQGKESWVKAAVFAEPHHIEVHDVPMPQIVKPGDAIIRVIKACVCGSDLWWFRGIGQRQHGSLTGHEAIGIIEEVGPDVRTLKPGDFVIAPFTHCCGACAACRAGFESNCFNAEPGGNAGYQAEYMRAYSADTALVKVPADPKELSEDTIASLLTVADVMCTGFHAAKCANIRPGSTAVVFGDGGVGLCGVLSAKLQGAERIIAMSRHEDRQRVARAFGATDIVPERGDEAVAKVMDMTDGVGADCVLECVGTAQSTLSALAVARPGGTIGRVGVPHIDSIDVNNLFWRNVTLSGGPASVTPYANGENGLVAKIINGDIQPGRIFTANFDLDHVQDAYEAMDERRAIKSMLSIGA